MYNKLTPQHYVDMIVDEVNCRAAFYMPPKLKKFTLDELYQKCIKKTKVLDAGDEIQIENIIKQVLDLLVGNGYISHCGDVYTVKKKIENGKNLFIFDNPPPMDLSDKDVMKNLFNIGNEDFNM